MEGIVSSVGKDLNKIDIQIFKDKYTTRAVDKDILESDERDIKEQLASLHFYSPNYN